MAVATYTELEPLDPVELARSPDDALREPLQALTRRLALDPSSWRAADREWVLEIFDQRAPTWDERASDEYRAPLADALARGRVAKGGRVADLGAATGLHNRALRDHFDEVVAVDLSLEMLRRAPSGETARCVADCARLPIADGALDALVLVNCFVYPPEYHRVLRPGGTVIFVSTRDAATPIYLPPQVLVEAFDAVEPGASAIGAKVGIGRWTVLGWR